MLSLVLLFSNPGWAAPPVDVPAQAARGKMIFSESEKATKCATCHVLEGKGTAIGPDLTNIARVSPKAIAVSILSTRTVYAKEVELKVRRKFPAMIVSETKEEVKLYDLSKLPPEPATVAKTAIHAVRDNGSWRHPPESTGYNHEQLADVIAYIRYAAYGDTKGVDPSEVK